MDREKMVTRISVISTILVIIVVIIVLINIWAPDKSDNGKIITFSYNENIDYKQKGYESIYSEVRSLLFENNVSLLYSKMDAKFLEDNSLTEENFKNYVTSNQLVGTNIKFLSYNYYENDGNVTYIIKYSLNTSNSNIPQTKTVNVIETAPYVYTLSFATSSIPTNDSLDKNVEIEGINFALTLIERKDSYIKFSLKVINVSNDKVTIDFRNLNTVSLLLDDNTKVKQNSIVVSDTDKVTLNKNSFINKELVFPINIENQGRIEYMLFSNISVDSATKNIKIEF